MSTPGNRRLVPLQAASVEDLLRIQGFPQVEDTVIARVAVGGANAVEAVVAARRGSIFVTVPGRYVCELVGLAGPDDP
jgi:hypothetical protein